LAKFRWTDDQMNANSRQLGCHPTLNRPSRFASDPRTAQTAVYHLSDGSGTYQQHWMHKNEYPEHTLEYNSEFCG
jgi:hypothetical protein